MSDGEQPEENLFESFLANPLGALAGLIKGNEQHIAAALSPVIPGGLFTANAVVNSFATVANIASEHAPSSALGTILNTLDGASKQVEPDHLPELDEIRKLYDAGQNSKPPQQPETLEPFNPNTLGGPGR